jgi:hypothetical protein
MSDVVKKIKAGSRVRRKADGRGGVVITLVKYEMSTGKKYDKDKERLPEHLTAICWTGNVYEIVPYADLEAYGTVVIRNADGMSVNISAGRQSYGDGCYRAMRLGSLS